MESSILRKTETVINSIKTGKKKTMNIMNKGVKTEFLLTYFT